MNKKSILLCGGLAAALVMAVAPAARAASLQKVAGWGGAGLPSDVSMYVYVPTNVAATPPVLTLIHYCGGSASAVFGQASGLVTAADKYGFMMVVPDNGARCWDVESNKAWTRSGGGDSDAIKQMVTYALTKYGGNAKRVYATGDSSGGMMTELLMAVYPDVFVGGAAFAGMPAGCRGSNESTTAMGYSGACAGGNVTHTGAQWGTIVSMMDPGYTGHRPRLQLFHGSADTTISPTNFSQAIVEWTNVLGLNTAPTTTTSGVQLGTHQATRQQWQNACGVVVLDAFLSMGGDHGPSDALFAASYVVPFLALDQTGAVDPEIAKCGGGGSGGGSGGGAGAGASAGAGGGAGARAAGGAAGRNGGGVGGAGGVAQTGGRSGAAGNTGTGGLASTGGAPGTGGLGSGGTVGSGGTQGSGGTVAGTGGTTPTSTGGTPGTGGTSSPPDESESAGCSCALAHGGAGRAISLVLGLVIACLARRRRARKPTAPI